MPILKKIPLKKRTEEETNSEQLRFMLPRSISMHKHAFLIIHKTHTHTVSIKHNNSDANRIGNTYNINIFDHRLYYFYKLS